MMNNDDIEQLFRRNYGAMFRLADRLTHDAEMARDIVHDVFASLLANDIPSVTPAYLMQGVRFACLKHIRSLSIRDRLRQLYALDNREIEDGAWPDEEIMAQIIDIVNTKLSEQCRRIVKLRFSARLTYHEIAEELSISETAVYKHLHHAIIVLRQNLNGNER